MDENRFRSLMRGAIGEEAVSPWLAESVRTRVASAPVEAGRRRWIVLLAAALVAVIAVSIFEVPRLFRSNSNPVVPAATPSPIASPTPIDAFNCKLPVTVDTGDAGFIDTHTGEYTEAFSTNQGPWSYAFAAKQWLPVPATAISPDGQSYGEMVLTRTDAHLHVHTVTSGADREIWHHSGFASVEIWGNAGIYVLSNSGSQASTMTLIVNPATGSARQVVANQFPFSPLAGDPHNVTFRELGVDADGHRIIWFYDLEQPAYPDWVFYEGASGQRVYIFKGTMGDSEGFRPGGLLADSTGIWFSPHDSTPLLWHWSERNGLQRLRITGAGAHSAIQLAGPCF